MPEPAKPRPIAAEPDARTVKRTRAEARFKGLTGNRRPLLLAADACDLLTTIISRVQGACQMTFLTLTFSCLRKKFGQNRYP